MAGKPPQGNQPSSASGKRPAISIDTNFAEPTRAQATKAAMAADRSHMLPTTRSNILVWSIVTLVMGLPIVAIIWLVVMPDNPVDRYPARRVAEARREMAAIGTRAKKVYDATPNSIPMGPTTATFGVTEQDLAGDYDIGYEMTYEKGILTIFAHNIFADPPQDLIMLMNLRTGEITYNRDITP